MKTKLFILFSILFFWSINAQIVNIPDANFKQRLLDAGHISTSIAYDSMGNTIVIDQNGNGEIEKNEALLVYRLDIRSVGNYANNRIVSLSGINEFSNLNILDCGSNSLNSVDFSGLIQLNYLSIYENNLSAIDISGLKQLFSLNVSNNNLSTIDLSNNDKLAIFRCEHNNLSNINFQNNINLQGINIGYNNISSIDVTFLSNLSNLDFEHNNLTLLDITKNKKLNSLTCSDNKLQVLDVSNQNLTSLHCDGNLIKSLDISNCSNMFLLSFARNPSLQYVNLKNNKYDDPTLYSCPSLKYICVDSTEQLHLQLLISSSDSPNCQISTDCSFLSVDEFSKSEISIYPNPVKDILNFKTTEKIKKAEIYDTNGRLIKVELGISNNQMNVSSLKTGTYVIKVISDKKYFQTKYIKQ